MRTIIILTIQFFIFGNVCLNKGFCLAPVEDIKNIVHIKKEQNRIKKIKEQLETKVSKKQLSKWYKETPLFLITVIKLVVLKEINYKKKKINIKKLFNFLKEKINEKSLIYEKELAHAISKIMLEAIKTNDDRINIKSIFKLLEKKIKKNRFLNIDYVVEKPIADIINVLNDKLGSLSTDKENLDKKYSQSFLYKVKIENNKTGKRKKNISNNSPNSQDDLTFPIMLYLNNTNKTPEKYLYDIALLIQESLCDNFIALLKKYYDKELELKIEKVQKIEKEINFFEKQRLIKKGFIEKDTNNDDIEIKNKINDCKMKYSLLFEQTLMDLEKSAIKGVEIDKNKKIEIIQEMNLLKKTEKELKQKLNKKIKILKNIKRLEKKIKDKRIELADIENNLSKKIDKKLKLAQWLYNNKDTIPSIISGGVILKSSQIIPQDISDIVKELAGSA